MDPHAQTRPISDSACPVCGNRSLTPERRVQEIAWGLRTYIELVQTFTELPQEDPLTVRQGLDAVLHRILVVIEEL